LEEISQEGNVWLSELFDRALSEGAQIVMRGGRKTVVIMPFDEYERLIENPESLSQFLLVSPLAGSGLDIERDKSTLI
jgi:hypothetical protein